eukprot:scaffold18472_cov101-Isochrysis_galbana.AAC.7
MEGLWAYRSIKGSAPLAAAPAGRGARTAACHTAPSAATIHCECRRAVWCDFAVQRARPACGSSSSSLPHLGPAACGGALRHLEHADVVVSGGGSDAPAVAREGERGNRLPGGDREGAHLVGAGSAGDHGAPLVVPRELGRVDLARLGAASLRRPREGADKSRRADVPQLQLVGGPPGAGEDVVAHQVQGVAAHMRAEDGQRGRLRPHVPQLHGVIPTTREQHVALHAKAQAKDAVGMARVDRLAGEGGGAIERARQRQRHLLGHVVVHADVAVAAGGGEAAAVHVVVERVDLVVLLGDGVQALGAGDVPVLDGAVRVSLNQHILRRRRAALGPEAQAGCWQDEPLVTQRAHQPAVVGVVDAHDAVTTAGSHKRVVGREADAEDIGRLARVVTGQVGRHGVARPGGLQGGRRQAGRRPEPRAGLFRRKPSFHLRAKGRPRLNRTARQVSGQPFLRGSPTAARVALADGQVDQQLAGHFAE